MTPPTPTRGSPTPTSVSAAAPASRRLVDAWQAALAAEHQAVFGYPLLGPRLPVMRQGMARSAQAAHITTRDDVVAALGAAGQTPVAAAADYPGLYPVGTATASLRLAVSLEDACATAWRYLYLQAASTDGVQASALRPSAQSALTASAVRAARWRALIDPNHATTPFPGV